MAKSDKQINEARMAGMAYALQIAKKDGIEALEKEIKFRNAAFVPLEVSLNSIKNLEDMAKERMLQTVVIALYVALIDSEHFGKTRLNRVWKRFDEVSAQAWDLDCNKQHFVTLVDMAEWLNQEYDCDFDIDVVRQVVLESDINRGIVKEDFK